MSLRWTSIAACAAMLIGLALPAFADDQIYVPLFSYRTGPFAGSGIPIADGMHDYLTMLNERDGGIGGVRLALEECETGYDTKKGIECYEAVKGKKPVIVNPWSTGITLALIPKAAVDKIPILSMAYGLSAAALGDTFPWIFNPPDTYWDGLSVIVKQIAAREGGFDKLKGKTIGYIYLDAPYGKEPIPLLQQLAKNYGFNVKLYPVAAAEMQNQSSQWLNVRRDRPNYMVMWGWGAMQPTAVKEAVKTGYTMANFYSIWWIGEGEVQGAGPGAKGLKNLNWHNNGTGYQAFADIKKYVLDKGLSKGSPSEFGLELYDRGVYNSVLIAEAIHVAQKLTKAKVVTGADVRRGMENLDLSSTRWKEIGLDGFANSLALSCADHNGHGNLFVQEWDGTKWVKASGDVGPMNDVVDPLLAAAAKEYVDKNTGWPKRTEACDHTS
ncbi:MAG TPA: ABC transporter substrate-binding protein [Stellaceae bacterium]